MVTSFSMMFCPFLSRTWINQISKSSVLVEGVGSVVGGAAESWRRAGSYYSIPPDLPHHYIIGKFIFPRRELDNYLAINIVGTLKMLTSFDLIMSTTSLLECEGCGEML